MVEEYDYQMAQENVDYEKLSGTSNDADGELLAVGSASLENRRVERRIRIKDGKVEEKTEYLYNGEVFHSSGWGDVYLVNLESDGETVVFGETPKDSEQSPAQEWAESYCISLLDEVTEIWEDLYETHVENA